MKDTRKHWNKTGWAALALAAMLAVGLGAAWAQSADELFAKAMTLADEEKYAESNQVLEELVKANPDHPDVYWKMGQNYYEMGERIDIEKDKAGKLDMYKKCEDTAKKGYDKNPNLADNAFWMAVGISQQAQTNGVAKTIISDRTLPKRIEEYYMKAVQAKEFHYKAKNSNTVASANYALGVFYRKIPSFPGASLLLGTAGDIDKSVQYSQKAHEMFTNNVEFTKEAGVSLMCRGTKNDAQADLDAGKKLMEETIALPAETATDRIDQADAKKLIADPKLACGYSRVQQEEVTADSIK